MSDSSSPVAQFMRLHCPTCGAGLQVAGEQTQFACAHCGNRYLLDRRLSDLAAAEREPIRPIVTYTQHTHQWLRVATYELFLHNIAVETVQDAQVLYLDVAYRNQSATALTCRHDQWLAFDREGYTYEPVKDFDAPELYQGNRKRYAGLSRIITPGMRLRGWLAFRIPDGSIFEYLQFSGGIPAKTLEVELHYGST